MKPYCINNISNLLYYLLMKLNKKDEYNIGEVVRLERNISLKPNTIDTYYYTGIIVKKRKKDAIDMRFYWFHAGEYDYMISIPEFEGDYVWTAHDEIHGLINVPREYKLHLISKFGTWWYCSHKSLYQSIIIESLQ